MITLSLEFESNYASRGFNPLQPGHRLNTMPGLLAVHTARAAALSSRWHSSKPPDWHLPGHSGSRWTRSLSYLLCLWGFPRPPRAGASEGSSSEAVIAPLLGALLTSYSCFLEHIKIHAIIRWYAVSSDMNFQYIPQGDHVIDIYNLR